MLSVPVPWAQPPPGTARPDFTGDRGRLVRDYVWETDAVFELVQMFSTANQMFKDANETVRVNVTSIPFSTLAIRILDTERKLVPLGPYNPYDSSFNWKILQLVRDLQQHGAELIFANQIDRPGGIVPGVSIDIDRLVNHSWSWFGPKQKGLNYLQKTLNDIRAIAQKTRPGDLYSLLDKEHWRHDIYEECQKIVHCTKDFLWEKHGVARKLVNSHIDPLRRTLVSFQVAPTDSLVAIAPDMLAERWRLLTSFIRSVDAVQKSNFTAYPVEVRET